MTQLLRDVIHVLTRPHIPEGESRAIYAEPLLETLQSLIHPSASAKGNDGGGGATGGSRPPISIDALALWQDISGRIDREWPYAGHPAAVRVPTIKKLQGWYNNAAQPHEALYLYRLCIKWEAQIREALHPPKRMPLKGECPNCQKTHVELDDEDGGVKYDTAIIAYPDSSPVYAECRVCHRRWDHEELHELAARLN